jgi:hypothetical protein
MPSLDQAKSGGALADEDCVGFEPLEVAQTTAFEGVAVTQMGWLGGRDSNSEHGVFLTW